MPDQNQNIYFSLPKLEEGAIVWTYQEGFFFPTLVTAWAGAVSSVAAAAAAVIIIVVAFFFNCIQFYSSFC